MSFPEDWVFEAVPPSDLREGDVFLPLRHVVSVSLGFQRWDPGAPIPQTTPTVFHVPADMVLLVRPHAEGTRRTDHLAADAIANFVSFFGHPHRQLRALLGNRVSFRKTVAGVSLGGGATFQGTVQAFTVTGAKAMLTVFMDDSTVNHVPFEDLLETDPVPATDPVSAPPPDPPPSSDPR